MCLLICVHTTCVWCSWRPRGGSTSLETGVTGSVNCLMNETLVLSKGSSALSRSAPSPAPPLSHTLLVLIPSKPWLSMGT